MTRRWFWKAVEYVANLLTFGKPRSPDWLLDAPLLTDEEYKRAMDNELLQAKLRLLRLKEEVDVIAHRHPDV